MIDKVTFLKNHCGVVVTLFNTFVLLISSLYALPLSAISDRQKRIFNLGIDYYNECSTSGTSSSGDINISSDVADANQAADEIFKALTTHNFAHNGNKPLNAVQAAAILGNLQSESGFNPKSGVPNGDFRGIAQWDKINRWPKIAEPKGLKEQVEFMIQEMDGAYAAGLKELWEAKTVGDLAKATFAWARNYEIAIQNGGGKTYWTSQADALSHIQGWDKQSLTGHANPRWPNAQAQYNRYKDQAPATSAGSSSSSSTSSTSGISGRIVWVGDSRTVGMHEAISDTNNAWIAEVSKGYDWFVNTALGQVKSTLKEGDTIVFALGVNDLGNVDKYRNKLNELAKGDWSKYSIIVLSVNPVDEAKEAQSGYSVKNSAIENFNNSLKNGLDSKIKFLDTYSSIKSGLETTDGVHYTAATYKKIYDIVRGSSGTADSSQTSCGGDSSSGSVNPNPNIDGYVFPFTVANGTTKQSDLTSWYGAPRPKDGMTIKGGDLCHATWANAGHCHHGPFPDGAIDLTVRDSYMQGTKYKPKGESYLAITSGTITRIDNRHGLSYCSDVMLKGDDGWVYWYGHGSSWAKQNLKKGQAVKAGDKINEMGVAACADNTSPHEHIDRGSPKGAGGGREGHRDTGMPALMNKLFKTLPE